ncbi:MAG TPA: hypothetical protein PK677_08880 [Acidiphilium sp.]|nr:MAG: hypothetical protein B7Z67_09260 [Acidiphilium sp. 21-60-14]OYV92330.1 MAG: hypothetical protein B7Z57_00730 [Acidiphilium sp. 37-60-79]OZB38790.1 MAG: hypothetical protein B7X48_11700 [Acidiphilium sp. 34-60-192]HQT88652.1 hypothetical protein [Acidiphilium sp.]HQU23645.1 hypothetical protein [Acidiphilium sp.]
MARLRLDHARPTFLPIAPRGLVSDQIVFGLSRAPFGGQRLARSAGVATEIYEPGLVVPNPFAVRALDPATQADADWAESPVATAAPIASGAAISLGRFLTEGLAIALLQRDVIGVVPLIGAGPTPAQRAALDALDLASDFIAIDRATRVRRMIVTQRESGAINGRVPPVHADRFMRVAIEALRFAVEPYEISSQIALRRPRPIADYDVANRLSFDSWLASMGVVTIDPTAMRIGASDLGLLDLAAALAGARCVVIDDPSQAGLLGFCDPGTKVVEIAVDGWTDPRIAAMCLVFALDWRVVLCAAPAYSVSQPVPLGSTSLLRTEIDIAGVAMALDVS